MADWDECFVCGRDVRRRKVLYVERQNALGQWQATRVCAHCMRGLAVGELLGKDETGAVRRVRRY